MNLATAVSDLNRALQVGEDAYQEFKINRLEKETTPVDFYAPVTFSDICTKKTKCKGKDIVLEVKADRTLFGHTV